MSNIVRVRPLGFPWETLDPFLFCVHHDDAYPAGNDHLGPAASLAGRKIGQDFEGKDGWRMYHGSVVPGFPQHPHCGFETLTIARRGYIDHSDSLGATARFGHGDAQWLTAGHGIVHAEMFPLVKEDAPNPVELFQIWINLPSADKLVDPHFTMLWHSDIPNVEHTDAHGKKTSINVVAGKLGDRRAPAPPPKSWAARPDTEVAVWSLRMAPGAHYALPAATDERTRRTLYFFAGPSMSIDGKRFDTHAGVEVRANTSLELEAGPGEVELLMLQGRPIGEPVAQYGPFVMNTQAEIEQAFDDYRRTQFGGWPWPTDDPNHGRDAQRFALHSQGGKVVHPAK